MPEGFVDVLEVDKSGMKGRVMVNDRAVNVQCKGRNILVRTGGGWVPFQQHLQEALNKLQAAIDEAQAAAAEDERLIYGDDEDYQVRFHNEKCAPDGNFFFF